jgi:hypothetical protein
MGKPTVWLNDGGVAMPADLEEMRCGAHRATMRTNVLIAKPQIGEVKKSSFVEDAADRLYGAPSPHDGESAKDGGRRRAAAGWPVAALAGLEAGLRGPCGAHTAATRAHRRCRPARRAVTMRWQEHVPSPLKVVGPDFKPMNKLAATR